ncbi:Hsp70 family protein [Dactylosporangium sp. NPDC051541]|uniref:Hsp70 family protein n=1 Tax=Dactylosporangium sp. NPDC051541 TaxID=3363977 RepID=UPI0037B994DD
MPEVPLGGPRLGIDFGTTHTVAVLGSASPLLFDASPLLSSAVAAEVDGRLLTGRDALRAGELDPARFEPNPKLRIGDGRVLLGAAGLPVEELIAAPLRRVLAEATRHLGAAPAATVLTCPATWAAGRRGVLLRAAAAAELPAVALVPEPVAAAWYHASLPGRPAAPGQTLAVYDLGGGTFDCTVLRRTAAGWDILATAGRDDVGGLDLDAALLDLVGTAVPDTRGWRRLVSPADPPGQRTLQRFRADLRAAKEQLSRTPSVRVHVPVLEVDTHVTREEFEARIRPLLEPTVELLARVLRDAAVRPEALFLVGGSSRVPLVATLLHRHLGLAPLLVDEPELVVARGALLVPLDQPSAPPPTATGGMPAAAPPAATSGVPASASPPARPSSAPPARPGAPRRRRGAAVAAAAVLALALVGFAVWRGVHRPGGADPGAGPHAAGSGAGPSAGSGGALALDIGGKVAWFAGFQVTFGRAEYDAAARRVTVALKVKNTLRTDRALTPVTLPITLDLAGRPTPGEYPGDTRTVGAGSEIPSSAVFDLDAPPAALGAGVVTLGADNDLRARVPLGAADGLVDLKPTLLLAPTNVPVGAYQYDNLTCEQRGDDPKKGAQVPAGSRAVACTFDVSYRGPEINNGIYGDNLRLLLPDGNQLAPDDAPSDVVPKDGQKRGIQAVWVVPAPVTGQYTLRLFDRDRYSSAVHNQADVKLNAPSPQPSR